MQKGGKLPPFRKTTFFVRISSFRCLGVFFPTLLVSQCQSPTMLHTCSMFQANHITHAPVLEVMGLGHHKDLRGFTSASIGTLWSTSLLIICSLYYHMLFKLTPHMFMFCLCINTPVCCMYLASSNINLATYFS